jgi:hypothetical protein
MLILEAQNVGVAPGTTTFTIPAERRRQLGQLGRAGLAEEATSAERAAATAFPSPTTHPDPLILATLAPEEQLVALQARVAHLDMLTREEELRNLRTQRIWTIVAGLVGVGGLAISIVALRRS